MPNDSVIGQAFVENSMRSLRDAEERIIHCLDQLDTDAIWWRPFDEANGIGNLLLHLCGNLQQWIIAPMMRLADRRERETEFSERGPIAIEDLKDCFQRTLANVHDALRQLELERLLESQRIQGRDTTILGALCNSLCHLRGHEQEIVFITRLQLQRTYKYRTDPAELNGA